MGTSRLTDAEVTSYIMQANEYVKLSVPYNSILPVKRIKDGYTHTWYVNTEVDAPESSKDGRAGHDVRTARTSGSANIQSYVNTFEIPRIEVTMAQDSGVPIWSENIAAATRKMNDTILHLQIRGSNALIDNVSITGMYGGGTDVNAGLDANKWNTPPAPILNHLAAGFGDLNDAGYTVGGLTWLMSSVLAPGLIAKYGAGDPSMRTLMADYGVARTIFLPTGTVSRMNVYPMGAAAGDEGLVGFCIYCINWKYGLLRMFMFSA